MAYRFLSILILPIFMLASLGLSVQFHYCHGKLNSISLMFVGGNCACKDEEHGECGDHADRPVASLEEGCCSNESYYLAAPADDWLNGRKLVKITPPSLVPPGGEWSVGFERAFSEYPTEAAHYAPPWRDDLLIWQGRLTFYG